MIEFASADRVDLRHLPFAVCRLPVELKVAPEPTKEPVLISLTCLYVTSRVCVSVCVCQCVCVLGECYLYAGVWFSILPVWCWGRGRVASIFQPVQCLFCLIELQLIELT